MVLIWIIWDTQIKYRKYLEMRLITQARTENRLSIKKNESLECFNLLNSIIYIDNVIDFLGYSYLNQDNYT